MALQILIVEDEPLYADQLQDLVEELGHSVCAIIDSGDMAIKSVQSQAPDLGRAAQRFLS